MDTPEKEIVVKYSSYTDAQKKATKKYRSNNRDKVNEQRKKYYIERKLNDPTFLEYKRTKAKEYYIRKKDIKDSKIDKKDEIIEEVKPSEIIEVKVIEPIVEEVKQEVPMDIQVIPETIVEPIIIEPKSKRSKKSKK